MNLVELVARLNVLLMDSSGDAFSYRTDGAVEEIFYFDFRVFSSDTFSKEPTESNVIKHIFNVLTIIEKIFINSNITLKQNYPCIEEI